MKANKLSPFAAESGWLITIPYVSKDSTFVSEKETAGFSQKSEIISVGGSYRDDHGNLRKSPCKKGDIVIHEYAQHEFEFGFSKYRAIKFHQVIGIFRK